MNLGGAVATVKSAVFVPLHGALAPGKGVGPEVPRPGLLESIDSPSDVRRLSLAALPQLARELRDYLLGTVSRVGGHLAAGLGSVELTVALHYVFDTPHDALVWDVGHQGYPHKILTGRREGLPGIRRRGGLSGFLRRDESPYDIFGAGHSSTSISAALGIAAASRAQGIPRKSVAIIGDGGLTAGLAYEALDHAGGTDLDLLVVLNDNRMSISPNVGAMSRYLARALGSRTLATVRRGGRRLVARLPGKWERAEREAREIKGSLAPGQLFEDLGFTYLGPVDGHDVAALVGVLEDARSLRGPRVLHVLTQKGHGYDPAEADPVKYHGVAPFPADGGIPASPSNGAVTYTQVFGDWISATAAVDPRLVAITPAMREGSGLVEFEKRFPDRYFDVGIAEQHSVTFAAGLATQGLKPVVAIYSTFLQRAYDQLIHDVALQRLPVLFAIDRAGLVGPDGATHNGAFDLSYLRCLPGLVVMTPADGAELRNMLHTGFQHDGPVAVRYPRAPAAAVSPDTAAELLPLGVAEVRRFGSGCALLVFGTLLSVAMEVAETIDATVINMRFVKPLDARMVLDVARGHELLVTLEENALPGGAGSAVNECLAAHACAAPILNLGLPDSFTEHGSRDEVLREAGLDVAGILAAIAARRAQQVLARRDTAPGRLELSDGRWGLARQQTPRGD